MSYFKHTQHRIFSLVGCLLLGCAVYGQRGVPITMAKLAPQYGIQQHLLEDEGKPLLQYIDTLSVYATAKADTCVNINARLVALSNGIRYDYTHRNDTLWIDSSHYLADATQSLDILHNLSVWLLEKAHSFVEGEQQLRLQNQQRLCTMRRDSIDRNHRTITYACDGIGVSDKNRQKQLKVIYYAYLSVFNRYNFATLAVDSNGLRLLEDFCHFQQSVIDNLLNNDNIFAQIDAFAPQLKQLCDNSHKDVYRSYLRSFPQTTPPIHFSTIEEYNQFLLSLRQMMATQQLYVESVTWLDKISDEGKHIVSLYSPKFRNAAMAYRQVESSLNQTPAFSDITGGMAFVGRMKEFADVQQHYLCDYLRLIDIREHGDTIIRACSLRYGNIAKAYRTLDDVLFVAPTYRTLVDAQRYTETLNKFEIMQCQYDTILRQRQMIDQLTDSVYNKRMSHNDVCRGLKQMEQHVALVPSYVTCKEGSRFIQRLNDHISFLNKCIETNQCIDQYNTLSDQFRVLSAQYTNLSKAARRLESAYINMHDINNRQDLDNYCQQLKDYAVVQQSLIQTAQSSDAVNLNIRLKGLKDIDQIKILLHIPSSR